MMYFKSRTAVRSFVSQTGRKIVDNGVSAAPGRRWAVKVV